MNALTLLAALLLTQTAAHAPSVLPNGDFEQADPARADKPAHWDLSDGLAVGWTDAGPGHGKAIRMDTSLTEEAVVASNAKAGLTQWVFPNPQPTAIGESYGLSLYSEAVPVQAGKTYKVTFDFRSDKGTSGKLWFRGYGTVNGQKKRLYEGTIDCAGAPDWKTFSGVFHPTKFTPGVTEWKIMLYSYFPDGVAWYDNIHVEAVDDDADATPQ
jgi:hypothetical protein